MSPFGKHIIIHTVEGPLEITNFMDIEPIDEIIPASRLYEMDSVPLVFLKQKEMKVWMILGSLLITYRVSESEEVIPFGGDGGGGFMFGYPNHLSALSTPDITSVYSRGCVSTLVNFNNIPTVELINQPIIGKFNNASVASGRIMDSSLAVAGAGYGVDEIFVDGDVSGHILSVDGDGAILTYILDTLGSDKNIGDIVSVDIGVGPVNLTVISSPGNGYAISDVFTLSAGDVNAVGVVDSLGGSGPIVSASVGSGGGGSGWVAGDKFTAGDAVGVVDSVSGGGGAVTAFHLTNPGSGFTPTETVPASCFTGSVFNNTTINPGSGYQVGDHIQILGGNNDYIAVATTVDGGGAITALGFISLGTGYEVSSTPLSTLHLTGSGDDTFTLQITAISITATDLTLVVDSVDGNAVETYHITNRGTGYSPGTGVSTTTDGGGSGLALDINTVGGSGGEIQVDSVLQGNGSLRFQGYAILMEP